MPLFSDNIIGVTITSAGVITIPAQAVANSFYYAQVLCDNTVIATIGLTLSLYDCYTLPRNGFPITYPNIGNRFNAGDVISFENVGYNALGSNVIFSYTLSAAEATGINASTPISTTVLNGTIISNILANLNDSIGVSLNLWNLSNRGTLVANMKISTVHNPANTAIFGQLLINGIVPADATSVAISRPKTASAQLTPCV